MSAAKSIPPGTAADVPVDFVLVGLDRTLRTVVLDFDKTPDPIHLSAADARTVGEALLRAADELEGRAKTAAN